MDGPKYVLNISRFIGPKWQVKGPGGRLVGAFHTKEEAEKARDRFNEPGAEEPPEITTHLVRGLPEDYKPTPRPPILRPR